MPWLKARLAQDWQRAIGGTDSARSITAMPGDRTQLCQRLRLASVSRLIRQHRETNVYEYLERPALRG